MSLEWHSLRRRLRGPAQFRRCHAFVGEPGETRVQNGSDDGANVRGCHVQPGIAGRDQSGQTPARG